LKQPEFIRDIANNLKKPLPGIDAQYRMAHKVRGKATQDTSKARIAGVMVLLFPKNEKWHVAFIQRPVKNPNDPHSGQISFPGGKKEEGDRDHKETALRETEEELGLPVKDIEVIGALTTLFIPVSNFNVFPFVGWTDQYPNWIPQESEVASVIEAPLEDFFTSEIRQKGEMRINKHIVLQEVPYFDLDGRILWGATAMIMNEFLETF